MSALTTDEAIERLASRLLPCHGGKGRLKQLWNLSSEDSLLHLELIKFIREQQAEMDRLRLNAVKQLVAVVPKNVAR